MRWSVIALPLLLLAPTTAHADECPFGTPGTTTQYDGTLPTSPRLMASDDGAVALWWQGRSAETAAVDAGGALVARTTLGDQGPPPVTDRQIASGPARHLVVAGRDDGLRGWLFDETGALVGEPVVIGPSISPERSVRVLWDGDRFVVAWIAEGAIMMRPVSADGELLGVATATLPATSPAFELVRTREVLWVITPQGDAVVGTRLARADLAPLDDAPIELASDVAELATASDGGDALLLVMAGPEAVHRAIRLDAEGASPPSRLPLYGGGRVGLVPLADGGWAVAFSAGGSGAFPRTEAVVDAYRIDPLADTAEPLLSASTLDPSLAAVDGALWIIGTDDTIAGDPRSTVRLRLSDGRTRVLGEVAMDTETEATCESASCNAGGAGGALTALLVLGLALATGRARGARAAGSR